MFLFSIIKIIFVHGLGYYYSEPHLMLMIHIGLINETLVALSALTITLIYIKYNQQVELSIALEDDIKSH